jgi:catecholate siderophore receptor
MTRTGASSAYIKARAHRPRPAAPRVPGTLFALGCFGLATGSGTAVGQEASDATTLGRISVLESVDEGYNTAERRSDRSTAPLRDTPQTVTVIPQQVIRETGARSLPEVLRNTPGITFSAGENGFGTSANNFSLRGFDASGSIYVDEGRDSGSYSRDVFNVESVEVVKGAAADNGRGNAGGYVNLTTKRPGLDSFARADVSYGFDSYDSEARKRASIDVNHAIGASTAVRFNGVYQDSGVPGRALAKNDLWGIAPSFAFGLGGSLRGVISWEHLDRGDRPDWGVPGATMNLIGFDPSVGFDPAAAGAPRDAYYGLATDFDDATSDAVLARVEYDINGSLTLSNQLRWTQVERESRYTAPTGFTAATAVVPTSTIFYRRDNDSISNLTNLSARFATGRISHNLAAGIEITRERSDAGRFGAAVPAPGATSVFAPDPRRAGAAPFALTETAHVDVDTRSFYVYDTLVLSDRVQLTGGLRGENYEVTLRSLTAAGAPTGSADGFTESEFSVGGKLGLVYKPSEAGSLYVSAGTSTLPPGSYLSNPDISRTGDNAFPGLVRGADPIRSWNYEVGLKWDFFGGSLSTTAALFRTEKRKVPVVGRDVPGGDPPGTNVLQGYHEQVVQGLELGVSGAITPAWSVFGGVLLSGSERRISAELDAARLAGTNGAGDYGTATRTNGDSLAFTPDFAAAVWTTYRLPFGLTVGGGLQHVGSQFLGRPDDATRIIANGRWGKLRSYTVVNALLTWEFDERVQVRLNVDNVADEKYAQSANWNGSRVAPGPSRSYLLSVGLDF